MSRLKIIDLGHGDTLEVEGTRAGVAITLDASSHVTHATLLRDQVRELRDALSTLLGETQISADEFSKAVTHAWNEGVEAAANVLEGTDGYAVAKLARTAKLEVKS